MGGRVMTPVEVQRQQEGFAEPLAPYEGQHTIGDWTREEDSADALDQAIDAAGLWRIYREVEGTLIQPRPGQIDKRVRIDRVLVPTERLTARGWSHGIIGIEAKRSGVKLGPALAQAIDYGRAVWGLPNGGFRIWLDWIFVWPVASQYGTVASIMAQNRIGAANADPSTLLRLKSGGQTLIRIPRIGEPIIGPGNNGTKVGSR
jgi:hypothetical protein